MRYYFLGLIAIFFLCGCSSGFQGKTPGEPGSGETGYSQKIDEQETNFYYDFEDVLVPKEMELEPEQSILFETPAVKIGVLDFSGRVDPVSLFDFFMVNMPKDNWQLRSYLKYGRYIMVYEKPGKDCIISITESSLSTHLQIWVTPRACSDDSDSARQPQELMLSD